MSDTQDFNSFSTNSGTMGTREFMESNSLVAKFAFILLVLLGFVILLRVGISAISYFLKPRDSPHLIDGTVDATQMLVFPQDPSNNGAVTIYRSVNANDGLEFTWSVWIYINNLNEKQTNATYKHIFSKGNSDLNAKGMAFPNNAPGLYIAPNTNALIIMMNTFNNINEEIRIPDIPLNKWVNVIIRCQNTTLDVYINGTISRSNTLMGVPKQNYGDVYVAMNGGFNGYISNLWYYNYGLGTTDIQNLTQNGPNTKMVGSTSMTNNVFNYLSLRWFFAGVGNAYNPAAPSVTQVSSTPAPVGTTSTSPLSSTPSTV